MIQRFKDEPSLILIGHSRGGAVASIVASQLPSIVKALILLDPVDDGDSTACNEIVSSNIHLPPTLILSTPYGGFSSYYRKSYSSACAPPDRGPEAFHRAYSTKLHSNTLPIRTIEFSPTDTDTDTVSVDPSHPFFDNGLVVASIVFPQIGHLQVLDNLKKQGDESSAATTIPWASVCANGEDRTGSQVTSRAKLLMQHFIHSFITNRVTNRVVTLSQ